MSLANRPSLFRSLAFSALAALMFSGQAVAQNSGESVAELDMTSDPIEIYDPLEPVNRAIFGFNRVVDKAALKPLAQGYRAVVPPFGRERVTDFLTNLRAPIATLHNTAQGDFSDAGIMVARFLINSTFGVLGIIDVASHMGLSVHDEDAGQTLAVWGIPDGAYIVLPIFGPSSVRDGLGMVADSFADPYNIYMRGQNEEWAMWARGGTNAIDQRQRYLEVLDDLERNSLDFYATMRSTYHQRRVAQISDSSKDAEQNGPSGGQVAPTGSPSGTD